MTGRVLASMAAALAAAQAPQPMACGPHGAIDHELAARYAERPIARGVTAAGWMMQLYAAAEGGTWSLLLTRPDGIACLVEHGEGIERPPAAPGAGA